MSTNTTDPTRDVLDGVQVVEIAQMIPAPYATMLLSDLGADVVKVENPGAGDYQRRFGPEVDGVNHRFANYNRNKRSLAVDLKTDEGQEVLLDLAAESDILVEGFRPGVVDRLGIDYEAVSAVNPAIVYCSLSGYGQTGPYSDWAGHDINYLGIAGLLDMTGERDGPPVPPGYPVSDFAGGLFAAFTTVSLLLRAERTGEGEYVDVSMTDVVSSWASQLLPFVLNGEDPRRGESLVSGANPAYSIYECADGEYVTLGALEPVFWEALCDALSLESLVDADLEDDAVRQAVREKLTETFKTRSRDEWMERLDPSEVPVAPVNSVRETVMSNPQLRERGLLQDVDTDGVETTLMRSPYQLGSQESGPGPGPGPGATVPDHGEHSVETLSELGYGTDEIEALRDSGVIMTPDV